MTPQPDTTIAERTIRWMGQQLRVAQFLLKAQKRKRLGMESDERATRHTIRLLRERIMREFAQNPGLAEKFGLDDEE